MSKIELVGVIKLKWDDRISHKYFDFLAKVARLWGYRVRYPSPHFSK